MEFIKEKYKNLTKKKPKKTTKDEAQMDNGEKENIKGKEDMMINEKIDSKNNLNNFSSVDDNDVEEINMDNYNPYISHRDEDTSLDEDEFTYTESDIMTKSISEKKKSDTEFTLLASKRKKKILNQLEPFAVMLKYKVYAENSENFLNEWFEQKEKIEMQKGCFGASINLVNEPNVEKETKKTETFCVYLQWIEKTYFEYFTKEKGHSITSPQMENLIIEYSPISYLNIINQSNVDMSEFTSFDEDTTIIDEETFSVNKESMWIKISLFEASNISISVKKRLMNFISDTGQYFVELKLGKTKQFSSLKTDNTNPVWNQNFYFKFKPKSGQKLKIKIMERGREKSYCLGRQKIDIMEVNRYAKPRWIPMLDSQYKLGTIWNKGKLLIQLTTDVEPPRIDVIQEIKNNTLSIETVGNILETGDLILFSDIGWSSTLYEKVFNQFCHIAMVIKIPQYNFMLVWQLTPDYKQTGSSNNNIHEHIRNYSFSDFPLFLKGANVKDPNEKDEDVVKEEEVVIKEKEDKSEESKGDFSTSSFLTSFSSKLVELNDLLLDKKFSRVCFRKVNFERSAESVQKLVKFKKKTFSKAWQKKFIKKFVSVQNNSSQNLFETSLQDKYVSGELIYGAYKKMGLLDTGSESDSQLHLPDHFSSRDFKFKLAKGVSLENEKWISRKAKNQSFDF